VSDRGEAPLPACGGTPPKKKPPSPPFGRYSPQEGEKQGEQRPAPLPACGGTPPHTEEKRIATRGSDRKARSW